MRNQVCAINRRTRLFDRCQVIGHRFPVPGATELSVESRQRTRDLRLIARANRRYGNAVLSEDFERDALSNLHRKLRFDQYAQIGMAVRIDETWSNDQAGAIDLFGSG